MGPKSNSRFTVLVLISVETRIQTRTRKLSLTAVENHINRERYQFSEESSMRKTRIRPSFDGTGRSHVSRISFAKSRSRLLHDSIVGTIGTISLAEVVTIWELGSVIEETNYREEKSCRCEYSQPVNAASVRISRDIPVLYRVSQSLYLLPRLHILVAEKNDNCFKVAVVNTLPRSKIELWNAYKWQMPVT